MIADLPQDFIDALANPLRKPVQLAKFYLGDETYALSDIQIDIDGFSYNSWVESWGTLQDNSSIENLFGNKALEIRTGNITLIVCSETRDFINAFITYGIENTQVDLLQWFDGLASPPQVIDSFVCQDPITISEGSMLFSIDLVSTLAKSNRVLVPSSQNKSSAPVIVGTVSDVPLVSLNTGVYATLTEAIDSSFTGNVTCSHLDNMPNSGTILIDEEELQYDGKTPDSLNIISRGLNSTSSLPHKSLAMAALKGTSFSYSVSKGPVTSITNVNSSGIVIDGANISVNSDPATITFWQWPPSKVIDVEGANSGTPSELIIEDITTATTHGLSSSSIHIPDGYGEDYIFGYVNDIKPTHKDPDIQYKVSVRFKYVVSSLSNGATLRVKLGFSNKEIPVNHMDMLALNYSEVYSSVSPETGTVSVYPPLNTLIEKNVSFLTSHLDELLAGYPYWNFGVDFLIEGDGSPSAYYQTFNPVFTLEYWTKAEGGGGSVERRRVAYEDVRCTVIGELGATVTPSDFVADLISRYSEASPQLDSDSFLIAHDQYVSEAYFFNGILPPEIRLHEAIKLALYEGMGRLKYNQGKIKYLSYIEDDDLNIDKNIIEDNVFLRSKAIEHYSTDFIKNNITVKFDYDQKKGVYLGTINKASTTSITRFGIIDEIRELSLITSSSVAEMHAIRMLRFLEVPPAIYSVKVFMSDGYQLEKGDKVSVKNFLTNTGFIKGNILSINREFGQGKSKKINMYEIIITHFVTL